MAVHVLDAICKLLEDMPCQRHFRRCTVLAKWPRGHVATLPSALKTPGWRKLKSIQSIKLYCLMLQNYILEIYIDLLHIVIWGYLFDLVWSCLILVVLFWFVLCFKVVCTPRSEAPRSLWVCAFRCSKRLAADHLHGAWAPTGHKISSEADENGWSDDQKQKRFADVCSLIRSV